MERSDISASVIYTLQLFLFLLMASHLVSHFFRTRSNIIYHKYDRCSGDCKLALFSIHSPNPKACLDIPVQVTRHYNIVSM